MPELPDIDPQLQTEIEAAVYRKMVDHFRKYPEVQNIDLMNVGYFCRNCFSKWYRSAATERGIEMDYEQAREVIYGMPYDEYKSTHQEKASEKQLQQYETARHKATE